MSVSPRPTTAGPEALSAPPPLKQQPSEKQPSEKQPSEKRSPEKQPSDKQPSEKQSAEKQPPEKQLSDKRRAGRLRRIRDLEHTALSNPDPLVANVGAINADLMRINYRLMKATDTALAQSAHHFEDFTALLPAVNVCSQLSRQIHRLTELDVRLKTRGRGEAGADPSLPPVGTEPPAP